MTTKEDTEVSQTISGLAEWSIFDKHRKAGNEEMRIVKEVKHKEAVNHPAHYSDHCSVECIDMMQTVLGPVGTIQFCIGNAYKYLWRYKLKDKPKEDLDKAKWYINKGRELCSTAPTYIEPNIMRSLLDSIEYIDSIVSQRLKWIEDKSATIAVSYIDNDEHSGIENLHYVKEHIVSSNTAVDDDRK